MVYIKMKIRIPENVRFSEKTWAGYKVKTNKNNNWLRKYARKICARSTGVQYFLFDLKIKPERVIVFKTYEHFLMITLISIRRVAHIAQFWTGFQIWELTQIACSVKCFRCMRWNAVYWYVYVRTEKVNKFYSILKPRASCRVPKNRKINKQTCMQYYFLGYLIKYTS